MPWSSGTYTKWNAANVPPNWVGDASVGIKIEAARHDTQDDDFATGINNCLTKDGQNTPTANLPMGGFKHTNVADATANNQYATYGQLQSLLPSGAITAYGAASAPTGWLLCNGAAISRTTYAVLFAVIGTTYGVGDGSTTFNIPNLTQRFPLGKAASGTGATLGATGGAIDHLHNVYGHYHNTTGAGASLTAAGQSLGTSSKSVTGTVGGSDGLHEHSTIEGRDSDSGTAPIDNIRVTGGTATTYTASGLIRNTASGHGHGHSLAVDIAHTHGSSSVSGTIGKVTGGLNGDNDQNTSSNNPPFLVVNYIIKT